jgi:hypothetical protein
MGKEGASRDTTTADAVDERDAGIRCPRCKWSPPRSARWSCSCLHAWNTFDTRGKCPACGHQWHETQCLSCQQWSPHADWYA